MANGWALGKFGGEFAQGTQTYVRQLQSGLFPRAYFAYTASHVRLWHIADIRDCQLQVSYALPRRNPVKEITAYKAALRG